jgi:hypothetical protein
VTFLSIQARRNYRALKGLIRLQAMMRGHGIKRQTMEALKCMQLLVKVQTQIHARRVDMMESRASQPHPMSDTDGIFGRWCTQVRGIKKMDCNKKKTMPNIHFKYALTFFFSTSCTSILCKIEN